MGMMVGVGAEVSVGRVVLSGCRAVGVADAWDGGASVGVAGITTGVGASVAVTTTVTTWGVSLLQADSVAARLSRTAKPKPILSNI